MYISKNLEWVRPYILKMKRRMPEINLPTKIKSYTHGKKPKNGSMGMCCQDTRVITLAPRFHVKGKEGVYSKLRTMNHTLLLDTLAHEIAHLQVWDHGPEHSGVTKAIFEAFDVGEECPECMGSGRVCKTR